MNAEAAASDEASFIGIACRFLVVRQTAVSRYLPVTGWEGPHYVDHNMGKSLVRYLKSPCIDRLPSMLGFLAGMTNFPKELDIMLKGGPIILTSNSFDHGFDS